MCTNFKFPISTLTLYSLLPDTVGCKSDIHFFPYPLQKDFNFVQGSKWDQLNNPYTPSLPYE